MELKRPPTNLAVPPPKSQKGEAKKPKKIGEAKSSAELALKKKETKRKQRSRQEKKEFKDSFREINELALASAVYLFFGSKTKFLEFKRELELDGNPEWILADDTLVTPKQVFLLKNTNPVGDPLSLDEAVELIQKQDLPCHRISSFKKGPKIPPNCVAVWLERVEHIDYINKLLVDGTLNVSPIHFRRRGKVISGLSMANFLPSEATLVKLIDQLKLEHHMVPSKEFKFNSKMYEFIAEELVFLTCPALVSRKTSSAALNFTPTFLQEVFGAKSAYRFGNKILLDFEDETARKDAIDNNEAKKIHNVWLAPHLKKQRVGQMSDLKDVVSSLGKHFPSSNIYCCKLLVWLDAAYLEHERTYVKVALIHPILDGSVTPLAKWFEFDGPEEACFEIDFVVEQLSNILNEEIDAGSNVTIVLDMIRIVADEKAIWGLLLLNGKNACSLCSATQIEWIKNALTGKLINIEDHTNYFLTSTKTVLFLVTECQSNKEFKKRIIEYTQSLDTYPKIVDFCNSPEIQAQIQQTQIPTPLLDKGELLTYLSNIMDTKGKPVLSKTALERLVKIVIAANHHNQGFPLFARSDHGFESHVEIVTPYMHTLMGMGEEAFRGSKIMKGVPLPFPNPIFSTVTHPELEEFENYREIQYSTRYRFARASKIRIMASDSVVPISGVDIKVGILCILFNWMSTEIYSKPITGTNPSGIGGALMILICSLLFWHFLGYFHFIAEKHAAEQDSDEHKDGKLEVEEIVQNKKKTKKKKKTRKKNTTLEDALQTMNVRELKKLDGVTYPPKVTKKADIIKYLLTLHNLDEVLLNSQQPNIDESSELEAPCCGETLTPEDQVIVCEECQQFFHVKCENVSLIQVVIGWVCGSCKHFAARPKAWARTKLHKMVKHIGIERLHYGTCYPYVISEEKGEMGHHMEKQFIGSKTNHRDSAYEKSREKDFLRDLVLPKKVGHQVNMPKIKQHPFQNLILCPCIWRDLHQPLSQDLVQLLQEMLLPRYAHFHPFLKWHQQKELLIFLWQKNKEFYLVCWCQKTKQDEVTLDDVRELQITDLKPASETSVASEPQVQMAHDDNHFGIEQELLFGSVRFL